jgi:hypothetical protein
MFFIKNVEIADAPWQVHNSETGTIIDGQGRLVAVVPGSPPELRTTAPIRVSDQFVYTVPRMESMPQQWHTNNQQLIACAPELLAALKEAAFHLDAAGIPLNSAYYDLINRASSATVPLKPRTPTSD